jgi:hypothetical protein
MYLLQNLGRLSVRANDRTQLLEIDIDKTPLPYSQAAELAARSARAHRDGDRGRQSVDSRETAVGETVDGAPPAGAAKATDARS